MGSRLEQTGVGRVKQYNAASMGTYRTLSAEDVRAVLEGFGISDYAGHRPIAAGTINTNLAVSTDTRPLFLRINEGKSLEDVEREGAIVAHVAARGVPTPPPLRTPAGQPYLTWQGTFVSMFPWVAGRTLERGDIGPAHARDTGAALARLHEAGADFPDHRPGRYEPDEIQRRFVRIQGLAAGDPVLAEAVRVLEPALARLAGERRTDLPLGLIHGDLFIDNVLYADGGALTALLDFEQASWGRLAYDLAVSVLAFGFGRDDFRTEVTRAFIDGYLSRRPVTPAERAGFGAELEFAACRFAVTRITDVYLRRAAGAPVGKDFRRYLQRYQRVGEHLAAGDGLLALT
jgi:homoserine kinase type II